MLEGIDVLRLGRGERHSGLVPEMMTSFVEELRQTARVPALRGIVLTGGGPSFCVGADLKWLAGERDPGAGVAELVKAFHEVVRAIREMPVPVVAAVNGIAAGGGLSLALAADYRVASSEATFTTAYFHIGLTPDGGSSAFLVRMIGAARALELLLKNPTLSADEACALGLVNEVAPPEALIDRACEAANQFSGVPAETLLTTRRLLDSATWKSLDAQLDDEAIGISAAAQRPEFRAALQAFVERRRART